jgi:hypothetical protein
VCASANGNRTKRQSRCSARSPSNEPTASSIVKLRTLVWEQQAEIDRLTERLGRYEDANGDRVRRGRTPAIH